ncbi:MAG: Hsp20/alpha crystallin family protein [Candidatus Bathyarchaeia archaeon]
MSVRGSVPGYVVALVLSVLGLLVLGVYMRLLFRGGGVLGVSLAALGLALLAYWIREVALLFRGEEGSERIEGGWDVDVIEDSKDIIIVARVPDPCEKVAVFLRGKVLHVKGEKNLKLNIPLKDKVRISDSTFKNRVLQVKLEKILEQGKA